METPSPPRRAGNLPADLTSFVGRRGDVAEIKNLLSTSRLVSLVGPGGVGKTRLVLRVAGGLRRAFSDGVWLVELADVDDPDLLVPAIAAALQVPLAGDGPPVDELASALRERRTLVILDNCEHLLEAVSDAVAHVLRAAPQLRVLTTTRQALRVSGELLQLVGPLEVPDPRLPLTPGAATQYAAMSLFVERAQAVVPSFALIADNEAAVARLCQRLEGNPLAIELAAVSLRVLSVQELVDALEVHFSLLTSGPRTAPARHQTLAATIDWSYDLCTDDEKAMWASCSVFAGHFDRAAAEAICSTDDVGPDSVLGVLAGLVDKSVLSREEHDGAVRFRMSGMLRDYGLARLREAGRDVETRDRHLAYFSSLIEQAASQTFGPHQEQWLLALQRDHANLREALGRSLSLPQDGHAALLLASDAWFYWVAGGQLLEGRHWLDQTLFADSGPSAARAQALWTAALIAVFEGDRAVADDLVEEALRLAGDIADTGATAHAVHVKGLASLFAGDLGLAETQLREADERYLAAGVDDGLAALVQVHRGLAALFDGEHATATTLIEHSRQACLAIGERWVYSYSLLVAALAEFLRDDVGTAKALTREALSVKRAFHDTLGIATGLDVLGWVAAADGQAETGATLLGAAHRVWDSVGEPVFGSKNFASLRAAAEDTIRGLDSDEAYDEAYARGAALDLDQALAYALGEPEPPGDSERSDPAVGLTPREAQVAELVGRGLSNKEIAATLVISQRTAEGHVQRILTKFGFTSRAQVATWVAEQRTPGPLAP